MIDGQHETFTGTVEVDLIDGQLSGWSIGGVPTDVLELLRAVLYPNEEETGD